MDLEQEENPEEDTEADAKDGTEEDAEGDIEQEEDPEEDAEADAEEDAEPWWLNHSFHIWVYLHVISVLVLPHTREYISVILLRFFFGHRRALPWLACVHTLDQVHVIECFAAQYWYICITRYVEQQVFLVSLSSGAVKLDCS